MRILIVNYRYFISGGPEKYMFNIKRCLKIMDMRLYHFPYIPIKMSKQNIQNTL
ncbi:hypothetical protein [Finegoldia magna]|uniref:hypothetical protein n=1 Tax=Finegoldia magna TaxID=1260 RepID=UPI00399A35E4